MSSVKKGLFVPTKAAQADLDRIFLLLVDFLHGVLKEHYSVDYLNKKIEQFHLFHNDFLNLFSSMCQNEYI